MVRMPISETLYLAFSVLANINLFSGHLSARLIFLNRLQTLEDQHLTLAIGAESGISTYLWRAPGTPTGSSHCTAQMYKATFFKIRGIRRRLVC